MTNYMFECFSPVLGRNMELMSAVLEAGGNAATYHNATLLFWRYTYTLQLFKGTDMPGISETNSVIVDVLIKLKLCY